MIGKLESKSAEFIQSLDKAKNNNDTLQQMMYVLSHDLSTPIRHIKGFSGLLVDRYSDKFDEEGEQWLSFIGQSSDKIQLLIHGILRFSRIWTNPEPFTQVNIQEIIERVIITQKDNNTEQELDIQYSDIPQIYGIESLWHIVISELIANAIFFQPEDQVPKINISFIQNDTGGYLSIQDNGLGVEKKYHTKLLDIFYHHHRKIPPQGIGLGLTLCQRVLERHGGNISFDLNAIEGLTVQCHLTSEYIVDN